MPRTKSHPTDKNILAIEIYFSQAIKDGRFKVSEKLSMVDAERELKHLPDVNWSNTTAKKATIAKRLAALHKWVDRYVSPIQWQRCLATLRQKKSAAKLRLRTLKLNSDVYFELSYYAEKMEISIGEAVHQLARAGLERLCAEEYAKKK